MFKKITNKFLAVTLNSPATEKSSNKKPETLASLKNKANNTIRSPANSSQKRSILQVNASGFKGREISGSPLGSHLASPIPKNAVNVQDDSFEQPLKSRDSPMKDET